MGFKDRIIIPYVLLVGTLTLAAQQALAVNFYVSNPVDTTNITSLRGAVMAANRHGGQTTIILTGTNYQLCPGFFFCPSIGVPPSADLEISRGSVTIIGLRTNVVVSAYYLGNRVFHVRPRASLTLKNLVLTGGNAPNSESGGAIRNEGRLELRNCVLSGNQCGAYYNRYPPLATAGQGGAIFNAGALFMENCTVTQNLAGPGDVGGNGGGIWNGAVAVLKNCLVSSNSAGGGNLDTDMVGSGGPGGDGGGIYNVGTLVLDSCTVNGNAAGPGAYGVPHRFEGGPEVPFGAGGLGGSGGGIWNSGRMLVRYCTVSANAGGAGGNGNLGGAGAGGNGAGIYNAGGLECNTCTITWNSAGQGGLGDQGYNSAGAGGAGGSGAGIFNNWRLSLTSCTIAGNACGGGGSGGGNYSNGYTTVGGSGGDGGAGGGISSIGASAVATLKNTIVALNAAGFGAIGGTASNPFNISPPPILIQGTNGLDGSGPDLFGGLGSGGFNLVGTIDSGTSASNLKTTDIVGSPAAPMDPLLGPLEDNGGPTLTHALLPGSPAIDRGNSFGIHRDQRGERRPGNDPGVPNATGGDGSDIGAVEMAAPKPR